MKNFDRLLAIDIGNTTISYGLFQKSRLLANGYTKNGNIPAIVKFLRKRGVSSRFNVITCSVVPKKALTLKKALRRNFKEIKIWSVGENVHPRVKMKYKSGNLGADRLVNIYGAIQKYKAPILIIGCGTAITVDYVSPSGRFEGGLILPGVKISLAALHEKTALLPRIDRIYPLKSLIGRNTKSAMLSGVLFGLGAAIDGLIIQFQKRSRKRLTSLMTGGFSSLLRAYVSKVDFIDPFHTLKSLEALS